LQTLLAKGGVGNETLVEKGLQCLRKRNKDGHTYFITNRTDKPIDEIVPFHIPAASIALFDPMTGKSGLAQYHAEIVKRTKHVRIQLQPFESVIMRTYDSKKTGTPFKYREQSGDPNEIKGEWKIEFLDGGPVILPPVTTSTLGSWTDLKGDEGKNFSGTARYSISFVKPAGNGSGWLLDLGKVNETAEVILNGKSIATLIGPVFQTVIPASALKATNRLEIVVANLMANRIAYMDRNNIPWKIFYNTNMPARRRENIKNGLFDASAWKPLPSGLSGPVTITALQ
jgi:hypothetical protein